MHDCMLYDSMYRVPSRCSVACSFDYVVPYVSSRYDVVQPWRDGNAGPRHFSFIARRIGPGPTLF